jgi:hypothetical protein
VLLIVTAAVAALALGACAPDPGPSGPAPTPWLAAGCIDSTVPDVPDFSFSGIANQANNATGHDTGDGLSSDGTCTGTPSDPNAVVRAADLSAAVTACAVVGSTVVNPPRLVDFGYQVPVDAWACIEAP